MTRQEVDSVYPRWRGEHDAGRANCLNYCGLSPLARGTLSGNLEQCLIRRFIPAGAGNTERHPDALTRCAVYPRWRGEHDRDQQLFKYWSGLSPLARGTRRCWNRSCRWTRFIPAGAGNTRSIARLAFHGSVYPRWRGEHTPSVLTPSAAIGLSPLARGTRS